MIKFFKKTIIRKFGILKIVTIDQEHVFTSKEMKEITSSKQIHRSETAASLKSCVY
jgi:hypothetical protein